MKTNFKRTSLALAMGLLGLGAAAQNAHAGAYTFADSQVSLQLFNADGSAVDASQFTTLVIGNSSSTQADLVSVAGVSTNSSPVSGDSLQSFQVNTGPTPPAAENTFTPVGNVNWYARSDTNQTGSVVTGTTLPGGVPAVANTISEINLASADVGQSNANTNNNTGFVFAFAGTTGTTTITADLSGITNTRTILDPGSTVGSIAGSSHTWLLSVTDNTTGLTVFSWTPDGTLGSGISGGTENSDTINLQYGSTLSSIGDTGLISGSGAASATATFINGRDYTFRIIDSTTSNATLKTVPEPSILGLMGIGLLGAGAARLRRAKTA